MSKSAIADLPDLVISSGGTTSNNIASKYFDDATTISVFSPSGLAETVVFESSPDGSTWYTVNDGSADVGPRAAGKCGYYIELANLGDIRIKSSTAVAAARTFKLQKSYTI